MASGAELQRTKNLDPAELDHVIERAARLQEQARADARSRHIANAERYRAIGKRDDIEEVACNVTAGKEAHGYCPTTPPTAASWPACRS